MAFVSQLPGVPMIAGAMWSEPPAPWLFQVVGPLGIDVNSVAPGLILPVSPDEVGDASAHKNPPEGLRAFLASGADHGKPDDLANTVLLRVSGAVGFVSGRNYCVFLGSGMEI